MRDTTSARHHPIDARRYEHWCPGPPPPGIDESDPIQIGSLPVETLIEAAGLDTLLEMPGSALTVLLLESACPGEVLVPVGWRLARVAAEAGVKPSAALRCLLAAAFLPPSATEVIDISSEEVVDVCSH